MEFTSLRIKKKGILLIIMIPMVFWSLSESLPLMISQLNERIYRYQAKNPQGISGSLTIFKQGLVDRLMISNIRLPLSRKSDPLFDQERFQLQVTGLLKIEKAGIYSFGTESDDGAWIWIDGKKILDNGGLHSRQKKMNFAHLQKGVYFIELKFENLMGEAYWDVFWIPPDETRHPLPLLPHPWGRVASGLFWSANLFFKIAQYWAFFVIPLLLYKVLFPSESAVEASIKTKGEEN